MISDKNLAFLEENGFLDNNTGKISLADKLEGKTKQYMKQTAVEWLQEQLKNGVKYNPLEKNGYSNAEQRLFEQAKEIEKHQIIDATLYGFREDAESYDWQGDSYNAEQYYNKTFNK